MWHGLQNWFDRNYVWIMRTLISLAVVAAVFSFVKFLAPTLNDVALDAAALKVVYVQGMPCVVVNSGITCDWTRFNPQEGR